MTEVTCPYSKAGCPFQVRTEYNVMNEASKKQSVSDHYLITLAPDYHYSIFKYNVMNCYLFQPSLWRSLDLQ